MLTIIEKYRARIRRAIIFNELLWPFTHLDVNEFVPMSLVTIGALDIVPRVIRNPTNTYSQPDQPSGLLKHNVTFGAKKG